MSSTDSAPPALLTQGGVWVGSFCVLQASGLTAPLALPCLAGGLLLLLARDQLTLHRPGAVEWLWWLWLLGGVLSAAMGLDPARSLRLAVPTLAALVIVSLLVRAASPGARALCIGLLLAGLLQALLLLTTALLQPAAGPALWLQTAAIPWLVVPNDWTWATAVLPFALYTLGVSWRGQLLAGVLLLGMALLLQSRLAVLCGTLALLMVTLPCVPPRVRRGLLALGILTLASLLVAWALSGKGLQSLHSRLQLWDAAVQLWSAHPWTGVGPHQYVQAYVDHLPATVVDPRLTPWPHSLLLELLAEWGALGTLIAGVLVVQCLRIRTSVRNVSLPPRILWALLPAILLEASLLRTWVWVTLALLLAPYVAGSARPHALSGSISQ